MSMFAIFVFASRECNVGRRKKAREKTTWQRQARHTRQSGLRTTPTIRCTPEHRLQVPGRAQTPSPRSFKSVQVPFRSPAPTSLQLAGVFAVKHFLPTELY